jgi:hypothetical protein
MKEVKVICTMSFSYFLLDGGILRFNEGKVYGARVEEYNDFRYIRIYNKFDFIMFLYDGYNNNNNYYSSDKNYIMQERYIRYFMDLDKYERRKKLNRIKKV